MVVRLLARIFLHKAKVVHRYLSVGRLNCFSLQLPAETLFLMEICRVFSRDKYDTLFTTGTEYTTVITRTTFVLTRNASRLFSSP